MSQIELRAAPHQHSGSNVPTIMRNVVYSMLPICAFSGGNMACQPRC